MNNKFSFTDSNKWSGEVGEVAEVFITYKDGVNTYVTVVAALTDADTSVNTYTLTQTVWPSAGKPTIADDTQPTVALAAAGVSKASTITRSVSGTINPDGDSELNLGD